MRRHTTRRPRSTMADAAVHPAVRRIVRVRRGAGAWPAGATVDRPGDRHEAEADRTAQSVVAGSGPGLDPGLGPTLLGSGGARSDLRAPPSGGGGLPLDPALRVHLEPRLGHDFRDVRVHADSRADAAATALGARAFTVGRDIVFRAGEYALDTPEGVRLLAHELTHVVQQAGPGQTPAIQRQSPDAEPPRFPDFPGLVVALEDDIGQNLFNYGHHFYRLATLYPDQPDLLEEAFGRYALGANVLETGFQFIGAERGTAEALTLGTGITFKGVNFLTSGELVIDYQFDLGSGVKLEAGVDLAVNPEDYSDVRKVNAGLSVVGSF